MAISGDTIVVGTSGDDDGGLSSGSAYVFQRHGTAWSQEAKLTASDAAATDFFGRFVSLSGGTVAVAAWGDDDVGARSGSAYVFQKPARGWVNATEHTKLTASDAGAGDRFGRSVSISGDTMLVGADLDDDTGPRSGSAYVFVQATPGDMIRDLIQDTVDLNLHRGIENSLVKKLDGALAKLEDGNPSNDRAGINNLQAFLNEVEAQRGKKISEEDADDLIADAFLIIGILKDDLL